VEEKKDNWYRSEREFGSFFRAIPLPDGAKLDEVKATFEGGVLEVTVPLAAKASAPAKKVAIEEPPKLATKTAA
jgi:HSP20 family protein